jgi:cyclase
MSIHYSNRRDFLRTVISGAAGLTVAYRAFGQGAPDPLKAEKLSANVVMISGDGGNKGLVIADDGLMMIDGGFANRAEELQKFIAQQDTHKIRVLFDTHWHGDHVGSNELLGRQGVKIIAHENAKKWLSQKVNMEAFGNILEPLKPEGLPTETFTKGGKMTFGKEKIEYVHVPLSHTDNDAYVFFPNANVLHTGDLFFNGTYPVVDYSTGGWIGGMATALDTLLKVGDANTKIIPGHGPLATKTDMKNTRDMLHLIYERLDKLSKQGKSVDDVVKENPVKDLDAKLGGGFLNYERFLRMAYPSIARHNKSA